MKDIITTVLELIGVALIVAGVWLFLPPLAFIVAGISLIGVSYLITRRGGSS